MQPTPAANVTPRDPMPVSVHRLANKAPLAEFARRARRPIDYLGCA